MTRISRSVEVGTPNPVSRRDGVTIWQMRRISNCVQSFASIRCRSCASTSQQNSVRLEGIDSGDICGQRSWDVPNNAISARACSFMWRMQADEENTIMPESGEKRSGCGIAHASRVAVPSVAEATFWEKPAGFCGDDCGTGSFRRNGLGTVQELHRSDRCRKRDYPAYTDDAVTL